MRVLPLLLLSLALVGCDAGFVDLRGPPSAPLDPGVGRPDAGAGHDGGTNSTGEEALIASGPWGGRADYQATGTASLVLRADGQFELQLSDDFSVSRVPGPVVVLSRRDNLSGGLSPEQGDVELGVQAAPSGAQIYAVPAGADDRRFAWIYCKPFGIEVGRAVLEDR